VPGAAQISALFEDARWQLWLGVTTSNRIARIVGEAPHTFAVPNSAPTLDVRAFAEDAAGALWFGTEGSGLFRWDGRNSQRFTRTNGLGADTVWSLSADPRENVLWIGTSGGGLSCLDGNSLKTCTTRQGLHDDVICHIQDDGRGWLWFSSHKGIFRVAKAELREFFAGSRPAIHSIAYGLGDGLPTLECAGGFQPAGCRTRDGRLWFPTAKGLVMVNPAEVPRDLEPPGILIEELLVDDVPRELPMGAAAELVIAPGSHRFEFRFTALGAEAPELVRFKCQLEGFDPGWIELGEKRLAQYSGLRPGQYRFRIVAANRDGVWNQTGAALTLRVRPHFWQTWWFIALGVLVVAGGVALTVRTLATRRLRRRLELVEMQHALEQERTRIARDIHDQVGADLTQITLLGELARRESLSPVEVRSQVANLTERTRELVKTMEEIVWAVNPRNDPLPNFSSYLCHFAQEFMRPTATRCRLDVMPGMPLVAFSVQARHNLFLAVKEAFNNLVRHAQATEVWLRIRFEDGALLVVVEDNGRGFDPTVGRPGGNGLQNLRARVEQCGGRVDITSAPQQGTRIQLTLPPDAGRRTTAGADSRRE
jgi:signal transduction histidine kinase